MVRVLDKFCCVVFVDRVALIWLLTMCSESMIYVKQFCHVLLSTRIGSASTWFSLPSMYNMMSCLHRGSGDLSFGMPQAILHSSRLFRASMMYPYVPEDLSTLVGALRSAAHTSNSVLVVVGYMTCTITQRRGK